MNIWPDGFVLKLHESLSLVPCDCTQAGCGPSGYHKFNPIRIAKQKQDNLHASRPEKRQVELDGSPVMWQLLCPKVEVITGLL